MSRAVSSRTRRAIRLTRRGRATVAGTTAVAVMAVIWLTLGPDVGSSAPASAARPVPADSAVEPAAAPTGPDEPADVTVARLPGVGAAFQALIPADSSQVVLVSGQDRDSADGALTVWNRTADGQWREAADWAAHNGRNGWTDHHTLSDLRTPIGVYTLSDAGGLRRNPGSRLPYHQDADFTADGTGLGGETLDGAFDYVIAIDYNRVPGTSPLDKRRPEGIGKGGGIWLHVDHGGPTQGCVTLSKEHMVALLRLLDPEAHPVIVMGDARSLAG